MTPEKQLEKFLAKYTPDIADQGRACLKILRRLLPGAVELVYDNYNALVIGFGPSERASEAICSIALYPRYVTLFFLNGARLPDPERLLEGSGKQVRGIRLDSPARLNDPAVTELLAAATELAPVAIDSKTDRRMVIRSVSAKQRPRKPPAARSRAR